MQNIYLGRVTLFAGRNAPQDYALCDGAMLPVNREDTVALYSVLGTTYGGDGATAFALPELMAPAGMDYIICVSGDYPQFN